MKEKQKYKSEPLVSVVISCYNIGHFLGEAISSVKNQTYKNWEIIVVDDESTEPDTIKAWEVLKNQHLDVQFYRVSHRRVHKVRNFGIKKSKGELICVLDGDDILDPAYLSKCVNYLNRYPKVSIVSSYVRMFGAENGVWRTEPYDPIIIMLRNCIHGASVFRRKVYSDTGGYDPLVQGYEDWEYWINAVIKGHQWGIISEELFYYRKHPNSKFLKSKLMDAEIYNYILKKHKAYFSDHLLQILSCYRADRIHFVDYCNQLLNSELVLKKKLKVCRKKNKKLVTFAKAVHNSRYNRIKSKIIKLKELIVPPIESI